RNLMWFCLGSTTILNLGYLLYTTVTRAQVVETLNGFGFTLAECALIDLAIRATPSGNEGLGFALLIAVRNFGLYGSDVFGSWLLDRFHISFNWLIAANSVTTAIAIPLALLLPAAVLMRKDAERQAA